MEPAVGAAHGSTVMLMRAVHRVVEPTDIPAPIDTISASLASSRKMEKLISILFSTSLNSFNRLAVRKSILEALN